MELRKIPKDKIVLPEDPLRNEMDEGFLQELGKSIDDLGLLHPISVRPVRGGKFEVVYGGQRLASHPDEEIEVLITDLHNVKIRRKENLKIEEVAELQSIAENYMRKDISGPDLEKRIHAYHEKGWTQEKIAELTGISQDHICVLIDGWNVRQLLLAENMDVHNVMRLPIRTIKQTKGLEPDERIQVLKRAIEGKETSTQVAKITAVIKKAPEEIKKALLEGTISIEETGRVLETAIEEGVNVEDMSIANQEQIIAYIETATERAEEERKYIAEILSGEEDGKTTIKYGASPDQKRFKRFLKSWETIQWWSWAKLKKIENEDMREKAIDTISRIHEHTGQILQQFGRMAPIRIETLER